MAIQKPILIVVAGPNGSGKTTVTEKLLRHQWMRGCRYVNPDIIAQEEYGDWNSPEAVIQAAEKAREIRRHCLLTKMDMAFETVFSTIEKVEFVLEAKAKGFFIRLFFVCTESPAINAQRVAKRLMNGGHDVPIPKIINRYYRSLACCAKILPQVDRTYLYDNSENDVDAKLLFRLDNGKVVKKYAEPSFWVENILPPLSANR